MKIKQLAQQAGVENLTTEAAKEIEKLLNEIGLQVIREAAQLARKEGKKEVSAAEVFAVSGKKRI